MRKVAEKKPDPDATPCVTIVIVRLDIPNPRLLMGEVQHKGQHAFDPGEKPNENVLYDVVVFPLPFELRKEAIFYFWVTQLEVILV